MLGCWRWFIRWKFASEWYWILDTRISILFHFRLRFSSVLDSGWRCWYKSNGNWHLSARTFFGILFDLNSVPPFSIQFPFELTWIFCVCVCVESRHSAAPGARFLRILANQSKLPYFLSFRWKRFFHSTPKLSWQFYSNCNEEVRGRIMMILFPAKNP